MNLPRELQLARFTVKAIIMPVFFFTVLEGRQPSTIEIGCLALFIITIVTVKTRYMRWMDSYEKPVIQIMRQHDHGISALEIRRIGLFDENVYRALRSLERNGYLFSPESHAIRGWTPHIIYELTEKGRTTIDF